VTLDPGLWKFNNSLLKDKNYLILITESNPIISEKYANIVDKRLRWELIKMDIRSTTIPLAAHKAKEFRKQESDLQKRLDEIDKSISNSSDNHRRTGTFGLGAAVTFLHEKNCEMPERVAVEIAMQTQTFTIFPSNETATIGKIAQLKVCRFNSINSLNFI